MNLSDELLLLFLQLIQFTWLEKGKTVSWLKNIAKGENSGSIGFSWTADLPDKLINAATGYQTHWISFLDALNF